MDHSDKVKQNLEILGLESLEGLTLAQLSDVMAKSLPLDVSKKRILNVYVMWLHSRLMTIDISTDDFTQEITSWYRSLKLSDNDGLLIAEAFGDWQCEQAVEDPASLRRLSIAEAELRRLMTTAPPGPQPIAHSAEAEDGHGQMHPDRVRLSQETPTVIDLNDDDSDIVVLSSNTWSGGRSSSQNHGQKKQPDLSFLTGSNMLALDKTAGGPLNGKLDVARPQNKPRKSMPPPSEPPMHNHKGKSFGASKKLPGSIKSALNQTTKPPSSLSFLTGSNKLALDGTAWAPSNRKLDVARPQDKSGKSVSPSSERHTQGHKGKGADASNKPREGYRCRRCGKPGHPLQQCPTNMDPSFDIKPDKGYRCLFCKKAGDHFMILCHRNPDPTSIGRRRQRLASARGRTDSDRPTEYRDGPRRDYSPDFYDDRRSRFDGPTRGQDGFRSLLRGARGRSRSPVREGRGRSRSPVREGRGRSRSPFRNARAHDRLDRYVPELDFSRLSLSRETRPKRKATRSPSPDKTTTRKKNTAWVKKDVWAKKDPKNWATWKPARLDDLMSGRNDRGEGRLSYDDEVDGDDPMSSPAMRSVRSPSTEMMEVDRPEPPAPKVDKRSVQGPKDKSLELAVLDMIQTESVKTDLLLFINGVEHLPPLDPFLAQLFKGQESLWANKTLKKTRPCSTDFFEFFFEDEESESTDCEMVDEMGYVDDEEKASVCAREEAADSVMESIELACPLASKNEDEDMRDIVLAAGSAINANSAKTATYRLPVEEPIGAEDEKTETGDIEILANDGYLAERVGQEAAPVTVDDESDQSRAPAEAHAEVIVIPSSSPAHAMEAEMTPKAARFAWM